ncbi:MAG TPA: DUF4142 domain-containing protein [Ohtaekwangia sp.]|uniref:DUF4142 domain-containing protein n=1 Tax=Ohtaekwangia sp. TaxID=2066019 RepID=UPI002F9415D0
MKKYAHVLFLLAVMFAAISCETRKQQDSKEEAEDTNKDNLAQTDIKADGDFAVEAADGGMLEVELGKLAESKGIDAQVKAFGQSMAADHGKANEELKSLAQQKNIAIPGSLSEKSQKTYDDLAQKSGTDFDKAYIKLMVDDHQEDIDAFKKQSEKGNDPDLKAWATAKLPILSHHLEMAKQAKDALDRKK